MHALYWQIIVEEESKNNTVATEHTPCEVGLFSGDNTEKEKAAFTPNKFYEQSFKGKELSDYVPAVQVEDTGTNIDSSSHLLIHLLVTVIAFPFEIILL